MSELHIAEIPYESGVTQYRYARKPSEDGARWIRDGFFQAFHPSGRPASEGTYKDGKEEGIWRDFHPNGPLAAEGEYRMGIEIGEWRYWDADGNPLKQ